MQVKQFWQTYRHFLLEILRDRIALSKQGDQPELESLAKMYLDKIETYGYCNNREMSTFLRTRRAILIKLIPDGEYYEIRMEVFSAAIEEAKQY